MIYGVSRSKEQGIGFSERHVNQRFGTLVKPVNPRSPSSTHKGLYSHFVPVIDKVKVPN